jgi:hypothetical protein
MTDRVAWRRTDAFYGGAAVGDAPTAVSPGSRAIYDVFLDGVGYMLDDYRGGYLSLETVPMQRPQQTTRAEPGENSLNSEGLWRRSQSSFHDGAGQPFRDRASTDGYWVRTMSDAYRFRTSRGVYVWDQWQLTLLPDTSLVNAVTGTNTTMCSTIGFAYYSDGSTVYRTDGTTTAAVTGTPGAALALTSVGSQVVSAHSTSGIYRTAAGSTTATSWVTGTVDMVGWAKGRVMAGAGPVLYNITTAFNTTGALPTPLYTYPDPSFAWVGFAEGAGWIYAAGNSGNVGLIHRISIRADGTGLDFPIVAGVLPRGETITTIFGYLGAVFVGTTRGFRLCAIGASGDLSIGRLVDIGGPVYQFAGWGAHIYFTWSNFDGSYTGIGRINPTVLTDSDGLVPAYASDLMAVGQGTVHGVAILAGAPIFGVDGLGVYKPHPTDLVPFGYVDVGQSSFGLAEEKVATGVVVSASGDGAVTTSHAFDGRAFVPIGTKGAQRRGVQHEVRLTLTRSTLRTTGPLVTGWTLFVLPTSTPTVMRQMTIQWAEKLLCRDGVERTLDVARHRSRLLDVWKRQELVTFQDGSTAATVVIADMTFIYDRESSLNTREWLGYLVLKLKEVA